MVLRNWHGTSAAPLTGSSSVGVHAGRCRARPRAAVAGFGLRSPTGTRHRCIRAPPAYSLNNSLRFAGLEDGAADAVDGVRAGDRRDHVSRQARGLDHGLELPPPPWSGAGPVVGLSARIRERRKAPRRLRLGASRSSTPASRSLAESASPVCCRPRPRRSCRGAPWSAPTTAAPPVTAPPSRSLLHTSWRSSTLRQVAVRHRSASGSAVRIVTIRRCTGQRSASTRRRKA